MQTMLNKTWVRASLAVAVVFFGTLLYLHLKICIYLEGYRLSRGYQVNNELASRKDYLLKVFYAQMSLQRLNQWANDNDFTSVERQRLLALDMRKELAVRQESRLSALFNRLAGIQPVSAKSDNRDLLLKQ